MNINMENIHLYHIGYSSETINNIPDGFTLLDNSKNQRSDWYEYWPIRNFLLSNKLKKNHFYGFFSPKFFNKTGHTFASLQDEIEKISDEKEVIFICPQPEVGAFFRSIYEGSDFTDPGALSTYQSVFTSFDKSIDLKNLITDTRNTIYSNYFIAKSDFWEKWLKIGEFVFKISEESRLDGIPFNELNYKTNYNEKGVQRKVFAIEGLASLITKIHSFNTHSIPIAKNTVNKGVLSDLRNEAAICDSLKIAYQETLNEEYLELFEKMSKDFLEKKLPPKQKDPKSKIMKQTPAHDKYNDTIYALLKKIKPTNVVEVGCMRGTLARAYLATNTACTWHGIDIDEENIEYAKNFCTSTLVANIEHMTSDEFSKFSNADTWIFGDVLEHLYNPWAVLERIKDFSKNEITIIACIPNSQHWNFQARVNSGMMQYENDGLFDRTHIRFFSRITMIDLFEKSGYRINEMFSRSIALPDAEKYMPHIKAMAIASGVDPEQAAKDANAFQYVITATSRK